MAATATAFAQTATSIAATATAQASATQSPTPVDPLAISPDESDQFADLGATATHSLEITNGLPEPGTINLAIESSEDWPIALRTADGDAIEDTNEDGFPDIGEMDAGETREIVVELLVPVAERAGVANETRLTASRAGSGLNATAELTTIVNSKLVLTIDVSALSSGDVVAGASTDGEFGNVRPAISYVAPAAVMVTIMSNGMWTGSCFGNAGFEVEQESGELASLNWRLSGADETWNSLSALPDTGCFPTSAPGIGSYVYDLELEVSGTDGVDGTEGSITFGARGAES